MRRTALLAGGLIIVAGLIAASDTWHEKVQQLIVWGEGVIALQPVLGMAVFVLLSMASAMIAFFSSAVLVPVAIYAWGDVTTALLLWFGWLLGGIASYSVGRFLGPRVAGALIGEEQLSLWRGRVTKRARFGHVLLFQAVVPSEIPGYVLGTLGYSFARYLAALALTELPYVAAVVFLGESFLQGRGSLIIVAGIGVVVIGGILFSIRSRNSSDTSH